MELNSSGQSPREEGELEDGEICDDDIDEKLFLRREKRPSSSIGIASNSTRNSRKCKPQSRTLPPSIAGQDFRVKMPFNRGPLLHPAFISGHRLLGGPSGPERPLPGQHCDPSPRSSFWERSHSALGRLRYRGKPNQGRGDWDRGAWGDNAGMRETGRPPPGRFEFAENHIRKESPLRKQKFFGRTQVRKATYNVAKTENGVDESFEDLLMKYKQIQLELECIRKEEKMALKPNDELPQKEEGASTRVGAGPVSEADGVQAETVNDELRCPERVEKKVFQAFNLKPLRQKLLSPAERDNANKKPEKESEKNEEVSPPEPAVKNEEEEQEEDEEETDLNVSTVPCLSITGSAEVPVKAKGRAKGKGKDEDEELSELQLRLLALQSASKKWQQKEQQVMKESKEKITKAKPAQEKSSVQAKGKAAAKLHQGKKIVSPGSVAKQAWRKQQLRTWKLQHQQEQQQEEEERRKREDEIRKIRDLSNQDEQYNRFMKLVGGKRRTQSKSSDLEHRKSMSKQGLDTSGNLYQYDNYDEVAMDTDSETNSPASSPSREPFAAVVPPHFLQMSAFPVDPPPQSMMVQELGHGYLDPLSMATSTSPPPLPPLPPEEPEQPPKPPFADEEEEEEMLLREELLKALANKRAVRSEETSSNSGPPSPLLVAVAPVAPRSHLAPVSQSRQPNTKFARGHPASRPPLVLPRHKAVVVQLNASDDSDSDCEAPCSTRTVFGGLESMIKEARRTAEAAKPKGASGPEKENNPIRTPEALPDAKKVEYRRLMEEIASREKRRVLKLDPGKRVPSPTGSDAELEAVGRVAAEVQVTEAENQMARHKNLLLKDEVLLKHLLQQEVKKRESLKAAETKVAKLKEQLLASEKIVGANKLLLKKLQEQVNRVQHRVSVKKHQALKLEKDLAQARAAAGRTGGKRRGDMPFFPGKLLRLDGSPRSSEQQFADLIAQKQLLQQLESEYALKIQKLKEAQAQRNREVQAEPPAAAVALAPPPSPSSFPLPQPSLHDLTQDKLTLAIEDNELEDEAASSCAPGGRRRSFRESGSFTKPKLRLPEATPSKPAKENARPPELFLGLNVEDLQRRYQESEWLGELMETVVPLVEASEDGPCVKELPGDLDLSPSHTSRGELKPVPFGPYHSPLLVFKSYRFSPYFRTKEKLSLSSVSYSNIINPNKCFCRFDLTGTCNDDDCKWQHMRNCTLNGNQLFQDILSYDLSLIGCSDSSTGEDISVATEKYINKLFGANKDRMGTDQKAVLLVSKVNESKGHVPPFTTCKEVRKWKPPALRGPATEREAERDSSDEEAGPVKYDCSLQPRWRGTPALDTCITPDDDRYFTGETDDISNLETSVLESPKDVQLWIKLAYKYLSQKESSASECLDAALNTLSRALEDNRENPEVWCHYLTLFAKRGKREEVQEMCEMAVEYAPGYQVWWTYLTIEGSFDGKDYVCKCMLQYLERTAGGDWSEQLSFQLLEALLYRVQLSLFTGRRQNALAILQNALKTSSEEKSIAEHLAAADRTLAWLSYIHLTEFDSLPASLYDPAQSNPSRIVSRDSFFLPWQSGEGVRTKPDMLVALFQDAVRQCTDMSLPPRERTLACLPLHTNLIALHQLLGRWEEALAVCEELLPVCPESCQLLEAVSGLHVRRKETDKALNVWLGALSACPHNTEIFYYTCKFLISQDKRHAIAPLFQEFVMSFCEATTTEQQPVNVLRYILGIPTATALRVPCLRRELRDHLISQMPFLCLVHCLWQSVHGSVGEAVEAFERALGTVMQEDVVQRLWLDYLHFTSSKFLGAASKSRDLKLFTDLVQRCLATAPTRFTVPFSSAQYWSCYRFHNKVISFYLSCLPQSQHSFVLERLRYALPANAELALRFLQLEWRDGNIQHLRLQTRMLSSCIPNCLTNWKIAIAVEMELGGRAEVRRLYRQALQKLPLCATLWKDQLLFQATEGGKTDKLRKLVDKCQEIGVSLDEPLNLAPGRTDAKDP